ncbi:MAG: hypothetical protein ACLTDV_04275 [Eubacterium sp.]
MIDLCRGKNADFSGRMVFTDIARPSSSIFKTTKKLHLHTIDQKLSHKDISEARYI